MNTSTSAERVDWLIHQSVAIYPAIDQLVDGEPTYRQILRLGINATAIALANGESVSDIGYNLLALKPVQLDIPGPLDTLAYQYADVQRVTLDREGNLETDARHAIHLMKLAVPYAQLYYPQLDAGKIATYSLTHDIVEAYANDTPSLGITPEQMKKKDLAEALAMKELKRDYANEWPEFIELIETYEACEDAEARFTKAFDKLDPGFTQLYTQGSQLINYFKYSKRDFFGAIAEGSQRMEKYASDFPFVLEDRKELTHRVAAITYQKTA